MNTPRRSVKIAARSLSLSASLAVRRSEVGEVPKNASKRRRYDCDGELCLRLEREEGSRAEDLTKSDQLHFHDPVCDPIESVSLSQNVVLLVWLQIIYFLRSDVQ